MTNFRNIPGRVSGRSMGRSLGLKLLLVCGLVLLMGIPAIMISRISYERSDRADEVVREVSERYGGAQTVMGPILVAPYVSVDEMNTDGFRRISRGEYVVFAEEGEAMIDNLETSEKKRSLFRVTTYQASVKFTANFAQQTDDTLGIGNVDWDQARIMIGISNVKGLQDDVYLTLADGTRRKFTPAMSQNYNAIDVDGRAYSKFTTQHRDVTKSSNLQYMSVAIGDLVGVGDIELTAELSLSGAQHISIAPFAQTSKASIISDWPHPGFGGAFPPTTQNITDEGFSAQWSVPLMARGIPTQGSAHIIGLDSLTSNTMQVALVQVVNPYQTVNRALKYAIMFIGLVFLAYFLFEVMIGVQVHPAQYVLIGLAQSMFYLLLLALSEHIGFSLAFVLAASATVITTSGYAGAVFGRRQYALRAGAVFAAVYGLLFILMKIEDFALLVGAMASFLAIAGTMYLTRHVNWYGIAILQQTEEPPQPEAG